MKVQPENIKIGDHLWQHGCLFEVREIFKFCYTDEHLANTPDFVTVRDHRSAVGGSKDLPCFVMKGSYVEGDRKMFNYFRTRISQGERCGEIEEYTAKQGNALAGWEILKRR